MKLVEKYKAFENICSTTEIRAIKVKNQHTHRGLPRLFSRCITTSNKIWSIRINSRLPASLREKSYGQASQKEKEGPVSLFGASFYRETIILKSKARSISSRKPSKIKIMSTRLDKPKIEEQRSIPVTIKKEWKMCTPSRIFTTLCLILQTVLSKNSEPSFEASTLKSSKTRKITSSFCLKDKKCGRISPTRCSLQSTLSIPKTSRMLWSIGAVALRSKLMTKE